MRRTCLHNRPINALVLLWFTALSATAMAADNDLSPLHDPCIIRSGDTYYVFSTGRGIPIRTSRDLIHWKRDGDVFKQMPFWAQQAVPNSRGFWAPDIVYANGEFRLYYTVSTFGSNRSAIGLVTTKSLNPNDPTFGWKDQGQVIASQKSDDFNSIDAAVMQDEDGRMWMTLGSFWSGLKIVELDASTGLLKAGAKVKAIARRPEPPNAIEAPFLTRRGDWYYLWASFDMCCRGTKSTYNVRVGRSKNVEGPYIDRDGRPMLDGGGTPVLAGHGTVFGPGHCAVLHDEETDLLVHHFYDGTRNGTPTLQVRTLSWDAEGWPIAGTPVAAPATQPSTRPQTRPAVP